MGDITKEEKTVCTVRCADITGALREVGVKEGDILLIHSSLKSFGYVEGGAMSVIEAAKAAVGKEGTVVFPTLVQRDFGHAYKNWDKDATPSDVGTITEVFRTLPGTLRSDQATHSVAAQGRRAAWLTGEHTEYGPRMGVFGDYCFSYASPWQKMYMENAKIVFIGVKTLYNTMKHFVEYSLVEYYLNRISPVREKCAAMKEIATYRHFEFGEPMGAWPFHDTDKTDELLKSRGLIRYAQCGASLFTMLEAGSYVDTVSAAFKAAPEEWFGDGFVAWLKKYKLI